MADLHVALYVLYDGVETNVAVEINHVDISIWEFC